MHQQSMHDSCGCGPMSPAGNRRPVVCPVQNCVVDNYFSENQDYIHPTHILVRNNHLLNNNHYFPYMVSEQNNYQTQDFAYPQGSSPDYNWMDYMNPQDMGQMPMEQGQMPMMNEEDMAGNGQMPMMGQGQMPMMGQGQMPMMGQGQMPMMGQGQMPMMGQGQMPMMGQGQMPMMGQGQMPMMGSDSDS
ncbi:CotD family spore coat protein [Halobacillus karajensis]|uniref:Inner spore coat protein D n=1 Tax=Halobacillus karajensis TaxID=195088 RepID=A0A024P161_9BACI|nr:CotD family spore coat protein [Halobacillus karajensis]CDQ19542.1 Inner spore coat protein D [Halobacillus karajensis]CDQ22004.1 Inner spore coat protein D [Halobacillus karajensis]CDQ27845.1 Inner spore coat protein D [Halobacillus karajensis]